MSQLDTRPVAPTSRTVVATPTMIDFFASNCDNLGSSWRNHCFKWWFLPAPTYKSAHSTIMPLGFHHDGVNMTRLIKGSKVVSGRSRKPDDEYFLLRIHTIPVGTSVFMVAHDGVLNQFTREVTGDWTHEVYRRAGDMLPWLGDRLDGDAYRLVMGHARDPRNPLPRDIADLPPHVRDDIFDVPEKKPQGFFNA